MWSPLRPDIKILHVKDQTGTFYQNRVVCLWFWVSLGGTYCALSPPWCEHVLHSEGRGGGDGGRLFLFLKFFLSSISFNNTGILSCSPDTHCILTRFPTQIFPSCPPLVQRSLFLLCRSPVCGLPTKGEDSHVQPGSHTSRGQAHVF